MRLASLVLSGALLTAIACRGAAPAVTPAPSSWVGAHNAELALAGRSTYRGTLELRAAGDSLAGTMRLVTPISVEATVGGRAVGDSLRIAGTYTAGNGCSGTMRGTVALATRTGPAELQDRCAGRLVATLTLRP